MKSDSGPDDEIHVSRAKLDSITVYDVTEDELEIIERGSPSSTYLVFAAILISVFASFLIAMLTIPIQNVKTYSFFMIVTVVSAIVGAILLVMWWRSNMSAKTIFTRIRQRKNSTAITEVIEQEEKSDAESSEPEKS